MAYRPITDMWVLARARTKYYGSYPLGFIERARALLGVTINDPVLHVCGGKVRDYPYLKRAVGPNDGTIDLDPGCSPDYLMDVRKLGVAKGDLFPQKHGGVKEVEITGFGAPNILWASALIDRPYTPDDADKYLPGADFLPSPNDLLKRALSVVRPGGRVGMLDYFIPRPPKKIGDDDVKFVALIGVMAGFGGRMRAFTVFERCATNTFAEPPEGTDEADNQCHTGSLEVEEGQADLFEVTPEEPVVMPEAMQVEASAYLAEGRPTICVECTEPGTAQSTIVGDDGEARHESCHRARAAGETPERDAPCACGHPWMHHDYRTKVCAQCGMGGVRGAGCQEFVAVEAEPTFSVCDRCEAKVEPGALAQINASTGESVCAECEDKLLLCRECWGLRPLPGPGVQPECEAKCDGCGNKTTLMRASALVVPTEAQKRIVHAVATEVAAKEDAALDGF